MLTHLVRNYDHLSARTVFMHGALPSCGYFEVGALHSGGHLLNNVSLLDYLTTPLKHRTAGCLEGRLFMPLSMRVSADLTATSMRSSYTRLPAPRHTETRAPWPITQHPASAASEQPDRWLPFETVDFPGLYERVHAEGAAKRLARNQSTPVLLPFDAWFRSVFQQPPPPVLFFAQGAQFAASAEALRHTPRSTYARLLAQIEAGHEEVVYYL